jgi:hypothetical protein
MDKPLRVSFLDPDTIEWCDQVKDTPEESRIKVFNRGIDQGSKAIIPIEGKTQPISILGDKLP